MFITDYYQKFIDYAKDENYQHTCEVSLFGERYVSFIQGDAIVETFNINWIANECFRIATEENTIVERFNVNQIANEYIKASTRNTSRIAIEEHIHPFAIAATKICLYNDECNDALSKKFFIFRVIIWIRDLFFNKPISRLCRIANITILSMYFERNYVNKTFKTTFFGDRYVSFESEGRVMRTLDINELNKACSILKQPKNNIETKSLASAFPHLYDANRTLKKLTPFFHRVALKIRDFFSKNQSIFQSDWFASGNFKGFNVPIIF